MIIQAWYKHNKNNRLYYTFDTILNKTLDTTMVGYRDHENIYVREIDDFNEKFTYVGKRVPEDLSKQVMTDYNNQEKIKK